MSISITRIVCVILLASIGPLASAQSILSGKLTHPRVPGQDERIPLSTILVFGSLPGEGYQPIAFCTWETHPAGWYHLAGPAGNYTVLFSNPAHFMRPMIQTNLFTRDGEKIGRDLSPRLDYACFDESAWDKAAAEYFQPFTARGSSVTQVGFKLAHDGVDGAGPGSQTFLVSIHRKTEEAPEKWPQIGPAMPVVNVDCGGAKGYHFSAGWNSGEVPTMPGETYAVKLRAEKGGAFQPFVHKTDDAGARCYRENVPASFQLWMSVSSDADGLMIPCNKRVHHQFVQLTKFSRSWTQTYTAQGRGLAGVILYAATSGVQPSMNRQRLAVRIREGGPEGKVIGPVKLAIGNGNFTGDASWGTFGLAYAPGEVAVKPGQSYALEFESIESLETLDGYVNIKGMKSDNKPGFNPYRRHPLDQYELRAAYLNGAKQDFDLDMQVIEYAGAGVDHDMALVGENLLRPPLADVLVNAHLEKREGTIRITPVDPAKAMTATISQRIEKLSAGQTYRLLAAVRCSHIADDQRVCMIGVDSIGQLEDAEATSIGWIRCPPVHGQWMRLSTAPIRPMKDAVSIFIRIRCEKAGDVPFRADIGEMEFRQVRTAPPQQ